MYFTKDTNPSYSEALIINNPYIPWKPEARYLVLQVQPPYREDSHQHHAIKQSTYALISRNSLLLLKYKLQLYKSIILPNVTYGSQIWGVAASYLIYKVQGK